MNFVYSFYHPSVKAMNCTVTPHIVSCLTRWVTLYSKSVSEFSQADLEYQYQANQIDDEPFPYGMWFKEFKIAFEVDQDDNEDDEMAAEYYLRLMVFVSFAQKDEKRVIFSRRFSTVDDAVAHLVSKLEGKVFTKCKQTNCYDLQKEEGLCVDCYIHNWVRGEECCVCHEDGGHWVRLKCGHVMHNACVKQFVEKKCPLCRESFCCPERAFF